MDNNSSSGQSGRDTGLGVSQQIANDVGDRLRRARESSGKTTQLIAGKVKIREPYLQAIEQGQWNELPPGLNGRGLVRIYARELAVPVPELEPKSSNMQQNQGDPVPTVQVLSRNALVEREISRASMDLVKSVPRTPNTSLSNPQSYRTQYNTPKRTPLPRPGGTPVPQTAPELPTPVPYSASSFPTRVSERDDEEPLDVVTPDVASILGISIENLPEAPVLNAAPQRAHTSSAVETAAPLNNSNGVEAEPLNPVSAEEVKAQPLPMSGAPKEDVQSPSKDEKEHKKNKHKKDQRGNQVQHQNPPQQQQPLHSSSAFQSAPPTVATENMLSANSDASAPHTVPLGNSSFDLPAPPTIPMASLKSPIIPQSVPADSTQLRSDSVAPESQPVSHLFKNQVGKASETVSSAAESTPSAHVQATKKPSRNIGLYAAAAVVFVAAGAVFFSAKNKSRNQNLEHGTVLNANGETKNTEGEPSAAAVSAAGNSDTKENPNTNLQAAVPDAPPAGSGISAVVTPQGKTPGAQVDAASTSAAQNGALGVSSGAQTDAKKSEENSPQVGAVPAAAANNNASATSSTSSGTVAVAAQSAAKMAEATAANAATAGTTAKLNILEEVELQVIADGKKVFNGTRQAGNYNVEFKKTAEILVQDGSKVKLTYGTWEHGLLGHVGRKRRIVLNAEPFTPEMNN